MIMNKEVLTLNYEAVTKKLRNILSEYEGMVLDGSLLKKIDVICRNIETELKKAGIETETLFKDAEQSKGPENFKERRKRGRRKNDNLTDVIGTGLCLLDRNLKIIWANKIICDWLDLKESPIGKCCHDIYRCSEIGTGNCPANNVFQGGVGRVAETWITTKTKRRMCVQHTATPITDENGNINNVLIHTTDATESEKVVHRLLLLQKFGEVMQGTLHLDKLLHLILTCVTSGFAFGFNRAMLFLINKEHNVLNGKLGVGPSTPEEANRIWQDISSKHRSLNDILDELDYSYNIDTPFNTMTKLMVFPLSDGREAVTSCVREKKPILINDAANDARVTEEFRNTLGANQFVCVPLITKNEPIGVIVADNIYTGEPIYEDSVNTLTMFASQAALAIEKAETYKRLEDKMDQLRETQQKLIHSEKLAVIGTMAAYVAHEIRNPLVTIGGFAKSLSRFTFTDQKIKTNINIILDEVRRLERIINNITDFSKPPILEKINVQICEIMENTCSLMENYFQERHVNLYKKFEPGIPQILADPTQMKQVFLNILMNAVESMPNGGDITVKIATVNESIKIDIIDSGKGMTKDALKNIFEPFFTTKSHGTGVGMAISLEIIENHGGNINVESECGKGTTMSLSLPIH
jgi:signal transduction histidine kinase/PAS domain-containing protein